MTNDWLNGGGVQISEKFLRNLVRCALYKGGFLRIFWMKSVFFVENIEIEPRQNDSY